LLMFSENDTVSPSVLSSLHAVTKSAEVSLGGFVFGMKLENYAEGTSKRTMRMSPNCRLILVIIVPVSKLYADFIRGQLHSFGRIDAKHV
jgi:hypothetical protein